MHIFLSWWLIFRKLKIFDNTEYYNHNPIIYQVSEYEIKVDNDT